MSASYSDTPYYGITDSSETTLIETALLASESNDATTLKLIYDNHLDLVKDHHEAICEKAFADVHKCKDTILFLFENSGTKENRHKKQTKLFLNYCLSPLVSLYSEMATNPIQQKNPNISQFYNEIYYQAYQDLFFRFIEINKALAALPEVQDMAFISREILNYLIENHLQEFLTPKTLFKMIQQGEPTDNLIYAIRGAKHFAVDSYTHNGYTSLTLALEQGNIRLAEQLVAIGSKLEKVFEFTLQKHASSERIFFNAFKIASFVQTVKISRLLEQNDYPKICFALAHGVEYDEKQLPRKSDPLITLLIKFKKIMHAASTMQLTTNQTQMIHFIKSVFKTRPFYRKVLFSFHLETRLIEKIANQPDQVERLIQKEIEENIIHGIPESYYLQKLLYIKFNLQKLKKPNTLKLTVNKQYPAISLVKTNADNNPRHALSQKYYRQ